MSDAAQAEETVWILGMEDPDDRGFFFNRAEARYERTPVPASVLQEKMTAFISSMRHVISSIPASLGTYDVDSITLKLEISAKGKVSLLGSGGELGGTGGITLTLKHQPSGGSESR
jgi:hypothetical protein